MKLEKDISDNTARLYLIGENRVIITYGGTGDLGISIYSNKEDTKHELVITSDDTEIYQIFDELYYDIKDINIYSVDVPSWVTGNERKRQIKREKEYIESMRKSYRLENRSNYQDLFNEEKKTITWLSDYCREDKANVLKIIKEDDSYRLEFSILDKEEDPTNYISVMIGSSGSRYDNFNIAFINMYNKLKDVGEKSKVKKQQKKLK